MDPNNRRFPSLERDLILIGGVIIAVGAFVGAVAGVIADHLRHR